MGMWFSLFKEKVEIILRDKKKGAVVIMLLIVLFLGWHFTLGNDVFGFCACIFCLALVVLSSRIKLDNTILQWLGTQSFAIYIMQRFPMNLLKFLGFNDNPYVFAILSIPSALLIACWFNMVLNKLDKKLFK